MCSCPYVYFSNIIKLLNASKLNLINFANITSCCYFIFVVFNAAFYKTINNFEAEGLFLNELLHPKRHD